MSGSYKITIIAAIVLCGGIVTYHLIQEKDPGITGTIVTPEPVQRKTIESKSPPTAKTPDQPGIGDLMSRLRNHLDTVEKTTPTQNDAPADNREQAIPPDTTTRLIEPNSQPQPQTPTLTFGSTPDDDVAVVAAMDNTPTKNPANTPEQRADRNDTPPINTRPTTQSPRNHTIQSGDTFSSIAVKIYGSEKHWIDIAMANPFLDPQKLKIGQSVRLPDIGEVQLKTKTVGDQPNAKQARTHIVRPGESLYSIADQYYSNADLWRIIFDANRTTLGADPDQLEAGEILKIPPAPDPKP